MPSGNCGNWTRLAVLNPEDLVGPGTFLDEPASLWQRASSFQASRSISEACPRDHSRRRRHSDWNDPTTLGTFNAGHQTRELFTRDTERAASCGRKCREACIWTKVRAKRVSCCGTIWNTPLRSQE